MFKGYSYMELWANNELTLRQKLMIEKRIACVEAGYPASEALYWTVDEYERTTGDKFDAQLEILERAADGDGGDD